MKLQDLVGKTITKITGDNHLLTIYFGKEDIEINIEVDRYNGELDITTVKKEQVVEIKDVTYNLFTGEKM